jgi:hypothetical protein
MQLTTGIKTCTKQPNFQRIVSSEYMIHVAEMIGVVLWRSR